MLRQVSLLHDVKSIVLASVKEMCVLFAVFATMDVVLDLFLLDLVGWVEWALYDDLLLCFLGVDHGFCLCKLDFDFETI